MVGSTIRAIVMLGIVATALSILIYLIAIRGDYNENDHWVLYRQGTLVDIDFTTNSNSLSDTNLHGIVLRFKDGEIILCNTLSVDELPFYIGESGNLYRGIYDNMVGSSLYHSSWRWEKTEKE